MGTKNITIDLEAYKRLKAHKRDDESLSQTIKRLVKPPFDLDAYIERIQKDPISKEAAEAVEEQVRLRRAPRKREEMKTPSRA